MALSGFRTSGLSRLLPDRSPVMTACGRGSMVVTEDITVLFTDVVGSTELAARLSPHDADKLRRRHFSILRQAIAEAGGTEAKSLADGLMVVFGAASAALSCAVAMQQGVERDDRVGVRT